MRRVCLILILGISVWLLSGQNAPLTLTAPNGGEQWTIGSTYEITWTSVNLAGSVMLYLIHPNNTNPQNSLIASGIPVYSGSYQWTIPASVIPGTGYKIKVMLPSNAGAMFYDLSDGVFTIQDGNNPPPGYSITVISPNGGENWFAGTTQAITWSYVDLVGDVRISLVQANGVQDIVLAPSVPIATGSYQWTIPDNFPVGMYRVHIVWLTLLAVYIGDISDEYFTVSTDNPPPPPLLTLTSPNGGEIWQAGTMHPITWDFAGNGGVVMLSLEGGPNMAPIVIIANNIPAGAGLYNWLIPEYVMPLDVYYVKVSLVSPAGVYIQDMSDGPFTITGGNPPPQVITITSPNGGESWQRGTTHTITWTDADFLGAVDLFLVHRTGNVMRRRVIARNAPNTGSYTWTIPLRARLGTHYKVAIRKPGSGHDISDGFFSIVAAPVQMKASPNPALEGTELSFELEDEAFATVKIFNIKGQCVRSVLQDAKLSGKQTLRWDGRDNQGRKVATGIYYARLDAGEQHTVTRIIVLK